MTAAQALGHTKSPQAVKPLLAAAGDPDEVVACTALSAIEETQSRESYNRSQRNISDDIAGGLRQSMADPRWRVRAAAAEVAGKLYAGNLTDDVKKLLGDDDGFVVKSALTALAAMGSAPDPDQLVALCKRLPSLQGDAVEMMLESQTDDTVKTVTDMFKSGNAETRLAILNAFLRRGLYDNAETDTAWKPMFKDAVASPDPRLRHAAVAVLGRRSPALSAPFVATLLADNDPDTRQAAAKLVLRILAADNAGAAGQRTFFSSSPSSESSKPLVSAQQIAQWHTNLLQRQAPAPDLNMAAAIFATGDGQTDMPLLLSALSGTNHPVASGPDDHENTALAIGAIMPKLALPADRPVLEMLLASPTWFATAANSSTRSKPEVQDFLFDPARFKAALEPATGQDLTKSLELLAGYDYEFSGNRQWSFWTDNGRTKSLALALANSTNAGWRAAAVFSLALRSDARDSLAVFEKAATDPDPWVRGSAARAFARTVKNRPALEKELAPLLADTSLSVAATAATGLLEPETRSAADLDSELNYFEYESVRGGRTSQTTQNDDRPLNVLDGKPPYLDSARHWLAVTNGEATVALAVLLAQFGDFSGVDHFATNAPALSPSEDRTTADALLAGIALSHDVKYLPVLKQMMAVRQNEWELRKILQAMKGMSGPDARQLRLDVNKKIRNTTGSGISE
jgi:HEAT repeat protein